MQSCCNHYVVTSTKRRKQQTVVTVCNKSKTKLSLANSAKITNPNQTQQKRKLELKYIKILIKFQLFRLVLKLPELEWYIKTLKPAHLYQFPRKLEILETLRMDSKNFFNKYLLCWELPIFINIKCNKLLINF